MQPRPRPRPLGFQPDLSTGPQILQYPHMTVSEVIFYRSLIKCFNVVSRL